MTVYSTVLTLLVLTYVIAMLVTDLDQMVEAAEVHK